MRKFVFIITIIILTNCSLASNHAKDDGERSSKGNSIRSRLSNEMLPSWVNTPPRSSSSYFFVGLGEDHDKAEAKKKSIQDALSQVTLLIHTSISNQNTFSSVYAEQENESNNKFSLKNKAYTNLKVKGQGSIRDFEIRENYHSVLGNKTGWYTLAEIPKGVVEEARKEIIALRERLKAMPAIVVAKNKLQRDTFNNAKLKAFFEDFYKSQGYTVIEGNISAKDIEGIKDVAISKKKAKILVYVLVEVVSISREAMFYVVEGNLLAREISLGDGVSDTVEKLYLDSGKGISAQSLGKAFAELEKALIDKLSGKSSGGGGEDSYM